MTLDFALSSWSVHGLLGQAWYEPDANGDRVNTNGKHSPEISLLALPALLAKDGIAVLEICHFHFPRTDDAYLGDLKAAIEDAGIRLAHVLIDTGNLSSLDDAQWRADIETNKFWQRVAAKLGADGVRIDCGTDPATPETIARSAAALQELADYGAELGLETTTENWRTTSIESDDLLAIMNQADRPLNLCVDFGNAEKTADKYATLSALLPKGTSIHCKPQYENGAIDDEDLAHCFSLAKDAGFEGYVTIICGDTDDEWQKILTIKQHAERVI